MPKLKRLSGKEIAKILSGFDFQAATQKGSHLKLKRLHRGTSQTLTIPLHKELDKGTSKAIYNQACRYIDESELRPYFYS